MRRSSRVIIRRFFKQKFLWPAEEKRVKEKSDKSSDKADTGWLKMA